MSGDVVIRAEGLGKAYMIAHQVERERYVALRDVMARKAQDFVRSSLDLARGRGFSPASITEEFWALRDVSFEVRRGEVVGIIGRNGAGKSTLLKVLSRITEPTEGRVIIEGRVASLLEVGPELTGRENIYLNGAILGMSRAEIRRKFDEIVAFAEVERFLDTPVKRYSSGMYVRLAFAVAAHLEPEILIVDEVLAVGDADFQKKCLGKMSDVASNGRTVLFVSHNMTAVRRLCTQAMVLNSGHADKIASIDHAIARYVGRLVCANQFRRSANSKRKASITGGSLEISGGVDAGTAELNVDLVVEARTACQLSLEILVRDLNGTAVAFASLGTLDPNQKVSLISGVNTLNVGIPSHQFADGDYSLTVALVDPMIEIVDRIEGCIVFTLERVKQGIRPFSQSWGNGSIVLPMRTKSATVPSTLLHAAK